MLEWLERIRDLFPSAEPVAATEPESSLKVERRFMLGAPALFAASYLLGRPQQAFGEDLSFDEATKRMGQLAKPMIADANRNEEEYLFQMAALASTIKQYPAAQFGEAFRKVMWSAMSYRGSGIAVIQWRMEPHATYQAHNHPGYSGMSVGIRGECRMRNFDYAGKPPAFDSKKQFLVRETQNTILREGIVTSMMSTTRDNIHELHAGKDGILAVDIITKVGGDQGFAFLDIKAKPRDAAQATYEAVWAEHQGDGV
jgi:hypothetical protein